MKSFTIFIMLLSLSSNANFFEKSEQVKRYEKRESELVSLFGEMKCYNGGNRTSICENKLLYCFKDTTRRGGKWCIKKSEIK